MLGESRVLFSERFLQSADTYFHQGVEHHEEPAFQDSVFQKMEEEISPHDHVHIKGANIREIMPWLWLAIRANPHDAEPYLIAAYWLTREVKKPELAQEVLTEAFRRNPGDYRILFEQGALHMRLGRREKAERALTAALSVWERHEDEEDGEARKGKAEILSYRSLLYELKGEIEKARRDIEEIVLLFPKEQEWRVRVEQLRRGGRPEAEVMGSWKALLTAPQEEEMFPDHDDHDHPHH